MTRVWSVLFWQTVYMAGVPLMMVSSEHDDDDDDDAAAADDDDDLCLQRNQLVKLMQ